MTPFFSRYQFAHRYSVFREPHGRWQKSNVKVSYSVHLLPHFHTLFRGAPQIDCWAVFFSSKIFSSSQKEDKKNEIKLWNGFLSVFGARIDRENIPQSYWHSLHTYKECHRKRKEDRGGRRIQFIPSQKTGNSQTYKFRKIGRQEYIQTMAKRTSGKTVTNRAGIVSCPETWNLRKNREKQHKK